MSDWIGSKEYYETMLKIQKKDIEWNNEELELIRSIMEGGWFGIDDEERENIENRIGGETMEYYEESILYEIEETKNTRKELYSEYLKKWIKN